MDTDNLQYPEFEHPATSLSAFTVCFDIFIISLKDGQIIKFTPSNNSLFWEWLKLNRIRDIRIDDVTSLGTLPIRTSFFNFKRKTK